MFVNKFLNYYLLKLIFIFIMFILECYTLFIMSRKEICVIVPKLDSFGEKNTKNYIVDVIKHKQVRIHFKLFSFY